MSHSKPWASVLLDPDSLDDDVRKAVADRTVHKLGREELNVAIEHAAGPILLAPPVWSQPGECWTVTVNEELAVGDKVTLVPGLGDAVMSFATILEVLTSGKLYRIDLVGHINA